jgi:hypothetical protein
VFIRSNGIESRIQLPSHDFGMLGKSRLLRRALRLDKCNALPVGPTQDNLVVIKNSNVYHYDASRGTLSKTMRLSSCRNVLHQSICSIENTRIYFGEYGSNAKRNTVSVFGSSDGGVSWQTVFQFPEGSIRHVHGCYWDPYEERLWILTGDFRGECYMLVANEQFTELEWLGDGSQLWRAVNVFFEPNRVVWVMDSQLETSHIVVLDRKTRETRTGESFPGPVWYTKRLSDGFYLAGTACELGPGVKDKYSHLMLSKDLIHWSEVSRFHHDGWPMRYFKFGVIGFADGVQSSDSFYIFGEALNGLDGRVYEVRLTPGEPNNEMA